MTTPEGKLKKRVIKILEDHGAYVISIVVGGYGKNGVPDIVFCLNGKFGAIECKAGERGWEDTTALQMKNINAIIGASGKAWVIDELSITVLRLFLKEMM